MHLFVQATSLRSKRFRVVSEYTEKDRGGIFASRFSFFALKPHANACYAGLASKQASKQLY